MTVLAFLAFTVALLATLPSMRTWLQDKRERAANGRVFFYRRFLTDEQRKRHISCLERLAGQAVFWNPEIGLVLTERTARGMTDHHVLYLPYYEIKHKFNLRNYAEFVSEPATVYREDFDLHPLVDPRTHERYRALLIDPEDTPGLDYLCRDLDRVLERERFNRWYGRPSWA